MASLGFRTVDEMIGRSDCLEQNPDLAESNPKAAAINLAKMLTPAATLRPGAAQRCTTKQVRRSRGSRAAVPRYLGIGSSGVFGAGA